jgi:hypothetical protein
MAALGIVNLRFHSGLEKASGLASALEERKWMRQRQSKIMMLR